MLKQFKYGWGDANRFVSSASVDARNFARWPIEAELRFEASNFVQSLFASGAKHSRVRAMEDDFKPRGHGIASDLDDFHNYDLSRSRAAARSAGVSMSTSSDDFARMNVARVFR